MREGLRALLESDRTLEIVGAVENGRDAVQSVGSLKPDVVLMDISMPHMDGMSAIREIKRRAIETKILVLTVHKTEEYIRAALQAGASGYVLKDASRAELLFAIQCLVAGKTFISPAVSDRIVTGLSPSRTFRYDRSIIVGHADGSRKAGSEVDRRRASQSRDCDLSLHKRQDGRKASIESDAETQRP